MHGKNSSNYQIPWQERCLAVIAYSGGLPLLALMPRWRKRPFVAHHYNHAGAVILLLFISVGIAAAVLLTLSYLLVFHRVPYERFHIEIHMLSTLRKMFLCWAVLWVFAVVLATLGSTRHVLLVTRLAGKSGLLRAAVLLSVAAYGVLLAVIPAAVHATTLVRSDTAPGSVYFVYEDLDTFPRWLFALGFYPLSLEARRLYGPGSTVLLPLSPQAVARAKREGRFVVFGVHGRPRGMADRSGWITPQDVQAMPGSDRLQFVYLSNCDSGAQRAEWEKAFAPARVVTFDRLSAVVEHIWWLWFRAPAVLRKITAETKKHEE